MRARLVKHLCLLTVACLLFTRPAMASEPQAWSAMKATGGFALGAACGFLGHEYAHLVANLALGNRPALVPIRGLFGAPFVAISPDVDCHGSTCLRRDGRALPFGRRGLALISAAGFVSQHLSSEVLLATNGRPLWRAAPLWQGFLLFNVLLSFGYATTCLFGFENAYGDATGLAHYGRLPRAVVASALVVPACLDLGRSIWPNGRVLAWTSWASKVAFIGLVLAR